MSSDDQDEVFTEARMASRLGVPRERLREAREKNLVQGVDFVRRQQGLAYTDSGRQKIAAALLSTVDGVERAGGADETRQCAADCAAAAVQQRDEEVVAKVSRIYGSNTWLEAVIADGRRVAARVRHTSDFRVGSLVCLRAEGGIWTQYGRTRNGKQ